MVVNRIVSFLPSATELLYEFGVEDMLFGVTHECKYPDSAKLKPQVISSVINSDELTSNEINTMTCTLLRDGKDIFKLNEQNLKDANPDLIISQETCEVCAAYTTQVHNALDLLSKKPELYSMDPHNLIHIHTSRVLTSFTDQINPSSKFNHLRNPMTSSKKRFNPLYCKNFRQNIIF